MTTFQCLTIKFEVAPLPPDEVMLERLKEAPLTKFALSLKAVVFEGGKFHAKNPGVAKRY